MAKSLVVVESPTKVKTLSRYLGKGYNIKATYGHIKDLPKSTLGVDIEKGFKPHFQILKGKAKVVEDIKKAGSDAETVYIGSDPDREGEAIAFHVAEVIGKKKDIKRILIHEITEKGVTDAIKNPANLDEAKYNAQKARRILDRLVGYKISPVLWEKVSYGLSAGRVQSVALRIICDREEEILNFKPEEYWTIKGIFINEKGEPIEAALERKGDSKIKVTSEKEAKDIKAALKGKEFRVRDIEIKDRNISPQAAFVTSKLQQEASRRLRFSPKKTMLLAQRLYEGINIGDEGNMGLITYMRTDSVRVSNEAIQGARELIEGLFGSPYLPGTPNYFKNKKTSQDAHEAIRPTYPHLTPEKVKPYLDRDLFALYELIWRRFIASQMTPQKVRTKAIEIGDDYIFIARGQQVLFDGFTRIYQEEEDEPETAKDLPDIKKGEILLLKDIGLQQRFTAPPPRYNEATLIKTLEAKGIGRPSTYATIVSVVQDRDYVKKDKGRLVPTPLGITINRLMKEFFPLVVDIGFTAKMEDHLDLIEDGKRDWVKSLGKFYTALEKELSMAKHGMKSLKKEEKETDIECERCGKKMFLRWGKNGEYLVCSGRPECKNKKNVRIGDDGAIHIQEAEIKGTCRQCGGNMIEKVGRFGRFLACSNYPDCTYTEPYYLGFTCPEEGCSGRLVERVSKKKKRFVSCSRYPDCSFATYMEPKEGECPVCKAPTLFTYKKTTSCLRKGCGWKSK
ncbi:MAG: type I DNA topoisomerase [Syntrophorhabdaceae bacterium]|nr:type I DNA topoisomerase [Syntrophorhabdales bacterium]MBP9561236.1 type I DNA topoisomerase [Syntrophorhabdaceae bacterium]